MLLYHSCKSNLLETNLMQRSCLLLSKTRKCHYLQSQCNHITNAAFASFALDFWLSVNFVCTVRHEWIILLVLWVVLSSLFLKEIWRNGTRGKDVCFQMRKESNKRRFDSYFVSNSVLIISHITFRDCRVHIFFRNFTRNSCIYKR